MPNRPAEAAPARAVDGYIRVSSLRGRRGDRFISPAVQREQLAAWATSSDVELLEVFEELDHAGAGVERPLLNRAIERIEAGVSDGLVVSEITRFHRSFIDGLLIIERVRTAGGRDDCGRYARRGRFIDIGRGVRRLRSRLSYPGGR